MVPKVVKLSLRKKWESMAQMTTERAPNGVYTRDNGFMEWKQPI